MTTLTFDFNEEKVKEDGLTTDELLAEMREYSKEKGIDEIGYGVFCKDGPRATTLLLIYVSNKMDTNPMFVKYLNTWILNSNGEIEDCKEEIIKEGLVCRENV